MVPILFFAATAFRSEGQTRRRRVTSDAQLPLQLHDPKTMSLERLLWEVAQLPNTSLRAGAPSEDRQHEFRLLRQIKPRDSEMRLSCFATQGKFGLLAVCPTKGRLELSGRVTAGQVQDVHLFLEQTPIASLPKTVAELFEMLLAREK